MDRDIGDYLEEYLDGIVEYHAGKLGLQEIPWPRMEELKSRYKGPTELGKLTESLYGEGINLRAINFDKKYESFQLLTNVLISASEYFRDHYDLKFEIDEEYSEGRSWTSLLFGRVDTGDIRVLFDAYSNFLKNPERYAEFSGHLLNEFFNPFLRLEENDQEIIDLEDDEVERLEDLMEEKENLILPLIEKQGLVIYSTYFEDDKIYLATDMFQDEAEKIIRNLGVPVELDTHSDEQGNYVTRLFTDLEHTNHIMTLVDTYVNIIHPRQ
jgi:hypothetical protein